MMKRTHDNIDKIIIHSSGTKEGVNYSVADLNKGKNSAEIGYHYVIRIDGIIEEGRPFIKAGEHCKGHDQFSIAICYVGGLDEQGNAKDTRTPEQKSSLGELVRLLITAFDFKVFGCNDFLDTASPGFNVQADL